MPPKILVVPDKFKGTLTARAAAQAIARGWGRARPDDSLELLPMTDGGDGFGEVMSRLLKARPQSIRTVNAAHHPCGATWWWDAQTKTAIVESAQVIGLAMLPAGRFHPFELDTFGLGKLLWAAWAKGARQVLVGIGGSATNDGGFGLARAMGWEFLAANQKPIRHWTELHRLVEIRPPQRRRFGRITVAVDVQNALLGTRGATCVYGPQKGLHVEDFPQAEKCLGRLAVVAHRHFGQNFAKRPGAGAAGGLGFGLLAFLGAKPEPGFELFARHAKLDRHLRAAGLVITGEGAIDRSTLMGKGTGEIARQCQARTIPCLGLAGSLAPDIRRNRRFCELRALTDLTTMRQAKARPAVWLERLAELTARGHVEPSASGSR
ncbi:MAG: glycerate kinase [Verrucomicrobia subdivision 3 bacterium]|nr:glycerate kinase [Limisphaerales bacterium]